MPPPREQTTPLVGAKGKTRLLRQVRDAIRVRHYSPRTEATYVWWIRAFVHHCGLRHPAELGSREIAAFLTHLAVERKVSASTQNQAASALLFLYRGVLDTPMAWPERLTRPHVRRKLPVVLARAEVLRVLSEMTGTSQLVARLLYGTGMRLMESMQLRVKDVDFALHQITVRQGKGRKDRLTMLPDAIVPELKRHLTRVSSIVGTVPWVPDTLRCPTRWRGSIRMLRDHGSGSGSSLPRAPIKSAALVNVAGITCTRA